MSGFNGRRQSNMFSSIANLNALPSEYELAMQQQADNFDLEADLAMFTNTQFFDFDVGEIPDPTQGFAQQGNGQSMDFLNNDFNLTDFSSFPTTTSPQQQLDTLTQPTPPLTQAAAAAAAIAPSSSTNLSRSPSVSLTTQSRTGDKRKASASETPVDSVESPTVYADEASRLVAEEDKRRRNTAASARFRVKKKQREQAMEKTAKDMTDRVSFLENRVAQLEMENKLLKDLITEKSGGGQQEELQTTKPAREAVESSRGGARKGVGTGPVKVE